MSLIRLSQEITYWVPTASDADGDRGYAAGVKVKARWASQDGVFTDDKGDDRRTSNAVYAKVDLPPRTMIALGDFEGQALPVEDARVVLKEFDHTSISTIRKYAL